VTSAARYDVVIIGAGPVGLAAAIELGRRNIRCLLIERNARVGYAPRVKTTNVRTRTHLRRWGIADRLAEGAPFGIDYPSNVHFGTRLAGAALCMFVDAFSTAPRAQGPRGHTCNR
jgi:2-polyprenyl-6-methoxyphenol hydroxylase-like FAD-dependent oxidoreductase